MELGGGFFHFVVQGPMGRLSWPESQLEVVMTRRLTWGILGTGRIAGQFAAGVNGSERGRLLAVGSRGAETGRDFAARFQVPVVHAGYESLLADGAVEAVYISLPNGLHHGRSSAAGGQACAVRKAAGEESGGGAGDV